MNIEKPRLPADLVHGDRYGSRPISIDYLADLLPPPSKPRRLVFSILKTFIWFTVLPVNKLMNWVIPPKYAPNYEIQYDQYYWLPIVGATVLSLSAMLGYLLILAGLQPIIAALLAGATYHLLYGNIHLEGLSDTIDALHAYPRKDPMTVLTEPYTGALGARYSGAANLLTTLLIASMIDKLSTNLLVLVPMLAIVIEARATAAHFIRSSAEKITPGTLEFLGIPMMTAQIKFKLFLVLTIGTVLAAITAHIDIKIAAITFISAQVAFWSGLTFLKRTSNYLKLIYGDIYGAAIIVAELAGMSVATVLLHLFV